MTNTALQTALAYYHAWTAKDLATAMTHVDDDVILDAPLGRVEGVDGYREFLGPFAQHLLVRADLLAAFGDEESAVLVYDTETAAVKSAPAAEYVRVKDGRITYNRFIFDRTPFTEAGVQPE